MSFLSCILVGLLVTNLWLFLLWLCERSERQDIEEARRLAAENRDGWETLCRKAQSELEAERAGRVEMKKYSEQAQEKLAEARAQLAIVDFLLKSDGPPEES
jgi:hypothetical protein